MMIQGFAPPSYEVRAPFLKVMLETRAHFGGDDAPLAQYTSASWYYFNGASILSNFDAIKIYTLLEWHVR